MSLKEPRKCSRKAEFHADFCHCADRCRITFRAAARSCVTKHEHLSSVSMNVDLGHVLGRGLMTTAVILSLY